MVIQKPRFEHGDIKAFAIETEDKTTAFDELAQAVKAVLLRIRIGQEDLFHHEMSLFIISQTNHESKCAATPQTAGLQIQKEHIFKGYLKLQIQLRPAFDDLWNTLGIYRKTFKAHGQGMLSAADEHRVKLVRRELTLKVAPDAGSQQLFHLFLKIKVFHVDFDRI